MKHKNTKEQKGWELSTAQLTRDMKKLGFTLVEVMVTMGIAGILLGFVVINVFKPQSSASLSSAVNVLVTDLRSQQLKSMNGDTGAIEASPSGVFFETTTYTLFTGGHYKPDDPNNFVVNLPSNTKFSAVSFPGSEIVFATVSGEIVSFTPESDSIKIQWSGLATKTVKFNKYGVVTQIN